MLLPVCLDPIQAWTLLKEKATGPALHIALGFFARLLCSLPHQPLSSTACPSLTAERSALVTLLPGHMTGKSSSPRGHRLACGPMTARGYLSGNDSPIFTGVQQCCPRPFFPALTPKLASPLTPLWHLGGGRACPSINTGSSWQNTMTLTNWSAQRNRGSRLKIHTLLGYKVSTAGSQTAAHGDTLCSCTFPPSTCFHAEAARPTSKPH